MKIGILTYHRAHNYGALLQAYALKNFLIIHGYSVEFIDYFPEYHRQVYANIERREFRTLNLIQKIKYPFYMFLRFYPLYILKEIRRQKFIRFIKKNLIKKEVGVRNTLYDVVIYGSDQIWRKQAKPSMPGFNDMYFGNDLIKAKKRIAFSASMGIIDLDLHDKLYLLKAFEKFAAISVREKDLYDTIKSFSTYPIIQTIDPVFLIDKQHWSGIASKKVFNKKFILFYNLHSDKESLEIAEYISSKLGYKIIELVNGIKYINSQGRIKGTCGPIEFLSLIENAEFVVTSSFHGVAVSIIFKKQFYACLMTNYQRVASLLSSLGIEDRLIRGKKDICLEQNINYTQISLLLDQEREKAINYLSSTLKNI